MSYMCQLSHDNPEVPPLRYSDRRHCYVGLEAPALPKLRLDPSQSFFLWKSAPSSCPKSQAWTSLELVIQNHDQQKCLNCLGPGCWTMQIGPSRVVFFFGL